MRITSRFTDADWYQLLMGTIHEGGHAIYEQNLPSGGNNDTLSIDIALSMGVHMRVNPYSGNAMWVRLESFTPGYVQYY